MDRVLLVPSNFICSLLSCIYKHNTIKIEYFSLNSLYHYDATSLCICITKWEKTLARDWREKPMTRPCSKSQPSSYQAQKLIFRDTPLAVHDPPFLCPWQDKILLYASVQTCAFSKFPIFPIRATLPPPSVNVFQLPFSVL